MRWSVFTLWFIFLWFEVSLDQERSSLEQGFSQTDSRTLNLKQQDPTDVSTYAGFPFPAISIPCGRNYMPTEIFNLQNSNLFPTQTLRNPNLFSLTKYSTFSGTQHLAKDNSILTKHRNLSQNGCWHNADEASSGWGRGSLDESAFICLSVGQAWFHLMD